MRRPSTSSGRPVARHRRRLLRPVGTLLILVFAAVAFARTGATAAPADDLETAAIKAAFVYNFAKFTTWPDGRFGSSDAPVKLCIQRNDLDYRAVLGLDEKLVGERAVRTEVIDPGSAITHCHVLFASGTPSSSAFERLLDEARRNNVLLVSDMPRFAELGGHIGLVPDRSRLRFQINLQATLETGIKLSSRLLNLAEIVSSTKD